MTRKPTKYDERYMWQVPAEDQGAQGTLLSDRIRLYVEAVHLIAPETYVEDSLRPASYDLHVGDTYYNNDKPFRLTLSEQLEIPRNGLVYIATQEYFNIPYYMVARYSLQVTQVYRGLLIENGLQVDPGYHGRIFVAVHNLTDEARSLARGDRFLSMDFTLTTPLPSVVNTVTKERHLISLANTGKLAGVNGNPVLLFQKSLKPPGKGKTPPEFWRKNVGEHHKSSLLGLEERTTESNEATRRDVERTIQRTQLISAAAFLTLLVALVFGILPWISGRYLETERAVRPLQQRVEYLEKQVDQERQAFETLELQVREMRSKVIPPTPTPPKIARP